ncbi:formylglycine-generating enzyme family protein [Pantoea sp. ME81]|uniref:formylglycine-generating enzyme family protein n=1 Tax=Pantoea sp. ME81 TaxID=2743935 RepID=UPI001C717A06|nr:formylglycine-generating enzyme family protein [Pantoea sp. ME81]
MTNQKIVAPEGMQWIAGGEFLMGSDDFYPEERPVREVQVEGFWLDIMPVTNLDFSLFIAETGYITLAEQPPLAEEYPDVAAENLVAGSMVFQSPGKKVRPSHYSDWWSYIPGACWHRPDGVNSLTHEDAQLPVVQIAFADALAYAHWAGKRLPLEAEWEFAACGGLQPSPYAWGADFMPEGKKMANTWQGPFPFAGDVAPGSYFSTSPVGAFPANPFGLHDMIGNVWEWTADNWMPDHHPAQRSCCSSSKEMKRGYDEIRKVLKGGSHLCAPNYCQRYRPAARQGQSVDGATTHIGFRCAK